MSVKDALGTRMKTFYEQIPKSKLMRRMPVIVRIDGKSFHTFTRGFERPFDEVLIKTMQETTKYLCENIQGCVLGYTQSDEISLVLVDYMRFETSAWFDYEVQKMCSISASMATMAFNKFFSDTVQEFGRSSCNTDNNLGNKAIPGREEDYKRFTDVYMKSLHKAMFDARVFNIPKEEVTNCIYWRQLDASRNSIQMLGQAYFSHSKLQNKSCSDIQDMLMMLKGINWNDLPVYQKRGSCCVREEPVSAEVVSSDIPAENTGNHWIIDKDIPIFKGDGREYIERLIMVGEE